MRPHKRRLGPSNAWLKRAQRWSAKRSRTKCRAGSLAKMPSMARQPIHVHRTGSRAARSSGSAAAVAGHVVDFALGTDTGGSVRVPSSFCGLYGIRTTHGRVPVEGVVAHAPSFDTVGWMARDARTFAYVSAVVLQRDIEKAKPARVLMAEDAFEVAPPLAAQALRSYLDVLRELGVPVESCCLASENASKSWLGSKVSCRDARPGRRSSIGSTPIIRVSALRLRTTSCGVPTLTRRPLPTRTWCARRCVNTYAC